MARIEWRGEEAKKEEAKKRKEKANGEMRREEREREEDTWDRREEEEERKARMRPGPERRRMMQFLHYGYSARYNSDCYYYSVNYYHYQDNIRPTTYLYLYFHTHYSLLCSTIQPPN